MQQPDNYPPQVPPGIPGKVPDPAPDEIPVESPPETPPDAPIEMPEEASPNAASNGYWLRDSFGPRRYVRPAGTRTQPGWNGLGRARDFGAREVAPEEPSAARTGPAAEPAEDTGPTPGTRPAREADARAPAPAETGAAVRSLLFAGAGLAGLRLAYKALKSRKRRPGPKG
ncbi:hypothetical protein [Frigidibacter sp. SD6-1]|uniref:hypothetical protein n=1 Tax=Frigidibacter sp. SD6-1 TaxID=3032581 RepID=UPI0024DFD313|nr:hypothetical protein [Frigidibacter sp. SD6-1]